MKEIMDNEIAENKAYDLVAKVYYKLADEPASMSHFGLNPEDEADRFTASVLVLAHNAAIAMKVEGFRNYFSGQLVSMIQYGIVDMTKVNDALFRYGN